jgi:hypothetical protein
LPTPETPAETAPETDRNGTLVAPEAKTVFLAGLFVMRC